MSLLEQFDHLRNQNPQNRLDATLKIFSILAMGSIPPVAIADLGQLRTHYGQDVEYTFKRLIKGLASNRESARLGFSGCLAELLRAVPLIDVSFVLKEIEKSTTPQGKTKGQEIRDNQFGRLFGIQSVVTSGLLLRKHTTVDEIRELAGLLFELSMEKGWLRESCGHLIIRVLDLLNEAAKPTGEDAKPSKTRRKLCRHSAELVHELLYSTKLSRTMEGIAIGLKCMALESSNKDAQNEWKGGDILRSENMHAIAAIMKDSDTKLGKAEEDGEEEVKAGTGTWKPKLHFSWLILISAIISSEDEDHVSLAQFWRQLVDESLFSQTSSHERKFHGFQLLTATLSLVEIDQIPSIFSPNLMRTLVNQASKDDRYLFKAAKNTLQQLLVIGDAQPEKALPILLELMGQKGSIMFDRLSKSKTCEGLMEIVPPASYPHLVQFIISLALDLQKVENEKEVDRQRQYIYDTLIALLRSAKTLKEIGWIEPILEFFVVGGFFGFQSKKSPRYAFVPPLTSPSKSMMRDKVKIALGCLLRSSGQEEVLYAKKTIKLIQNYEAKKAYSLTLEPDEQIKKVLESALHNFSALTEKYEASKATHGQEVAFILLYALSIIQVYAGESDGAELLADLEQTYEALTSNSKESTEEIQLLIDLLLALLSKESAVSRKLVETVFGVFAPMIDRNSLGLLLNVLLASETGDGLFDRSNEEEDDEMSDDDHGEEEDEEEESDDEDTMDEDDDDDNDDDDEEESDTNEEQSEADKALDAALTAALGTKRKAVDLDSDEESEEELMDDEAMMKLDVVLENIFKRRKQGHPGNKKQDARLMSQNTVQLKSKVLDLLEIMMKTVPESPLVIDFVVPLLQLSHTTKEAKLAEKAQALIRQKLTKAKILPALETEVVGSAFILDIMKQVHSLAASSRTPPQSTTCSQSSLYLAKLAIRSEEAIGQQRVLEQVCEVYAASQLTWARKKRAGHGASFFTDFINWCNQRRQNKH